MTDTHYPCIEYPREVLRRYHKRIEDEELFRFRKPAREKAEERPRKASGHGRSVWRQPIDLRRPAPLSGRPASASGATSYHFALEHVAKTRPEKSSAGSKGSTGADPATFHEGYASDLDKVEAIAPELFERYLNVARTPAEMMPEGSRASLIATNISDDPKIREAFWTAVWSAERTPSVDEVKLFNGRGEIDEWQRIAKARRTPPKVAHVAREIVRTRLEQQGSGMPAAGEAESIDLDLFDKKSIAWAKALRRPAKGGPLPLMSHRETRGGVVQRRLVTELPFELDPAGHCAVVGDLAALLENKGFMYTVVVHKPDARNDHRNYHIHAIWYERRCTWIEDRKLWDFQLSRKERRKLGLEIAKKVRFRLPEADEPPPLIDMDDPKRRGHEKAWSNELAAMRHACAASINSALERVGAERRIDPRAYRDMDIDKVPDEHLGPDAARMVAAGLTVEIDQVNARHYWEWRDRRLAAEAAARRARYAADLETADALLDRCEPAQLDMIRIEQVKAAAAGYRQAAEALCSRIEAIEKLGLEEAEARSSADRLIRNCDRVLASIAEGTATAGERREQDAIRARRLLADAHLAEIDAAIEPWAEEREALRRTLAREEEELVGRKRHLDRLAKLATEEVSADSAQRRWQAETVLPMSDYPQRPKPHAHFNALASHIRDRSLHIVRRLDADGESHFEVSGLGSADRTLLRSNLMKGRAQAFLADQHRHQSLEVGRVLAWIGKHGEAGLKLGKGDPDAASESVRNLFYKLRDHPEFAPRMAELQARMVADNPDRLTVIDITAGLPPVRSGPLPTTQISAVDPTSAGQAEPASDPQPLLASTQPSMPVAQPALSGQATPVVAEPAASAPYSVETSTRAAPVATGEKPGAPQQALRPPAVVQSQQRQPETGDDGEPKLEPPEDARTRAASDAERSGSTGKRDVGALSAVEQARIGALARQAGRTAPDVSASEQGMEASVVSSLDDRRHGQVRSAQAAQFDQLVVRLWERGARIRDAIGAHHHDLTGISARLEIQHKRLTARSRAASGTGRSSPERTAAIQAYAAFLREHVPLRIISDEQSLRIDPDSLPEEQRRAAAAFDDEPAVLAALRWRWEQDEDEKRKDVDRQLERNRRKKKIAAQILEAKQRPVQMVAGALVLRREVITEDLRLFARNVEHDPILQAAMAQAHDLWTARENRAQTRATAARETGLPASPGAPADELSQVLAGEERSVLSGPSVEVADRFRQRGKGRGG